MRRPPALLFLLLASSLLSAQGTRTWEQSQFEDFEKGTATGVAISSQGALSLAPHFQPLYTSPSAYLWNIASDSAGNIYAAAGSPARVYRISPGGAAQVLFEPSELEVQALAVRGETIYAATSPDGKVYKLLRNSAAEAPAQPQAASPDSAASQFKVASGWQASVFFDPHAKYIWALALDSQGRLYVASGDEGKIFRVAPDGAGSLFFQSEDAHVRSLAFDAQGNLIAGSDGSGLIYRISPAGEAFVLYSAPRKEITALAVDAAGNLYGAGVGEKRSAAPAPAVIPAPAPAPAPAAVPTPAPAAIPRLAPVVTASAAGGTEIYRIAPDGAPTLIWDSHDSLVYALAFTRVAGVERLLAATGNQGRVYAIGENGEFTSLAQASAAQVTGFAPAPAGGLYLSTANLGKVFVLGSSPEPEGSFESSVFDAQLFSRWGRLTARGAGNYQILVRSGNLENPDRNWSAWSKVTSSGPAADEIQAPPARFLQWKAVLSAGSVPPRLTSVTANYLTRNVAPVVDSVEVETPGATSQPAPATPAPSTGPAAAGTPAAPAPAAATRDHTVTIRWSAHDDNGDQLQFRLYYRGDGESNWLPLIRRPLTDKTYSFDAGLLPDGGYRLRVAASDLPSHSPAAALTGWRDSARFEIDTTPPQILDLHASLAAGGLHVAFRALDNLSPVRLAQYSLDAGDWQFIAPAGQLSDSVEERYDFTVPLPAAASGSAQPPEVVNPADHVLAVRACDSFGNIGSSKLLIH